MNLWVSGVESAGGGLRRVALRRETVARWAVYERGGDWCGECQGGAAEGCIEEGNGGALCPNSIVSCLQRGYVRSRGA